MKHLKIIGLAVVAAAAFMAFAGSASAAPTLTSPAGTEYKGTLHATAESSLLLKAVFSNVTCTISTVSGEVTTNNTEHATGPIKKLSFENCGENDPVPVTLGTLTVKPNGEVLGSNTTVTITNTPTNADCAYGTSTNTKLGTLTDSSVTKGTATMDINAVLPYNSAHSTTSQFLCGSTGTWSGSYSVTTPDSLFLS